MKGRRQTAEGRSLERAVDWRHFFSFFEDLQNLQFSFLEVWKEMRLLPPLRSDEVGPLLAPAGFMQWRVTLTDRAFALASDVMKLTPLIAKLGAEQAHIARQLFRSATAVGANLEEGKVAVSRRDMAQKHAIALREARETVYWLRLLLTSNALSDELEPLRRESSEMVAMLTASVKKLRQDQP